MNESRSVTPMGLDMQFCPTDENLIGYLFYRIMRWQFSEWPFIVEAKLYDDVPWVALGNLPESSLYWNTKKEGGYTKNTLYVFTETSKMSANSKRCSRQAGGGWWKVEKRAVEIVLETEYGTVFGRRMKLTFKVRDGSPTDGNSWLMEEYSLTKHPGDPNGESKCNIVLCKITKFRKTRPPPPTAPPPPYQYAIQTPPPPPPYQFAIQTPPGETPPSYQCAIQLPMDQKPPPPPPYQFGIQTPPGETPPSYQCAIQLPMDQKPPPPPPYQFGIQTPPGETPPSYQCAIQLPMDQKPPPPPPYQFGIQMPPGETPPSYQFAIQTPTGQMPPPPPPYQFAIQKPPPSYHFAIQPPTGETPPSYQFVIQTPEPPAQPPSYQFAIQTPPSHQFGIQLPTDQTPPQFGIQLPQFGTQLLPMLDDMDCEFGAPLLPRFPPVVDRPGTSASSGPKSLWEYLSEPKAVDFPRTSQELNKKLDLYETAGATSSTAPDRTPINAELQNVVLRSRLTDTLKVLGVEDDFHYHAPDQIGVPTELQPA